jgi:predicted dehydrogenase
MGEAQQTAWKYVRDGRLGTVRVAYAEVNWGRIESWHPNPEPFYDIGVVADVAVYPLAILSAIFGPVRRVHAFGRVVMPDRATKEGRRFTITTPEFVAATLEMESGTLVRLTANWYVMQTSKQQGIEFHGDDGSLFLSSWLSGDAKVEVAPLSKEYAEVELVRPAERGIVWSRGVAELAAARREERLPRLDGEHGAHIVEVIGAFGESMATGTPVAVASSFTPPAPMEWAI